jgi:hypothetical protein
MKNSFGLLGFELHISRESTYSFQMTLDWLRRAMLCHLANEQLGSEATARESRETCNTLSRPLSDTLRSGATGESQDEGP